MNLTNELNRISVLIPVFNDQTGVDACLQAIARQTYPVDAIEVIVVDNGSTPPLVLRQNYPFRTHLVVCEAQGSYAARNAGVRVARGEILAFTDADCRPTPEWIVAGLAQLAIRGGMAVVGGNVCIDLPSRPTATALYQYAVGFGQTDNVCVKGFAATANLFCTREQFDLVGPFDERLLSGGDREWCWRAARHGISVAYGDDAVVLTAPRSSLGAAVRQARRVAAGRRGLRTLGLAHIGVGAVVRQRSPIQAVHWILTHPSLSYRDRLRVFGVALVIRAASALENVRLVLGARAERR